MQIDINKVPHPVRQVGSRMPGRETVIIGGAVRDIVMGKAPADWDLEVFGAPFEAILPRIADLNPKIVGKEFGIVTVTIDGEDGNPLKIDISVPREDNHFGVGHSDVKVSWLPNATYAVAGKRRDLTCNSMSLAIQEWAGVDTVPGTVLDPHGGLDDIAAGILRATDPFLFKQDALRVLRVMPRAANGLAPNEELIRLCRSMSPQLVHVSNERVEGEWTKLMGSERPSKGIEFLDETGILADHYPEMADLKGCPQNPLWHPEGDVLIHSLLCVDAAASIAHTLPEHQRLAFVFAAMLHDVGKRSTTITQEMVDAGEAPKELLLTARGHDMAGGPLVESFLGRMTRNKKLHLLTRTIVEQHMQPHSLLANGKRGAYIRLNNKMRRGGGDLHLLAHQCMCDSCATGDWQTRSVASGSPNWEHLTSEKCLGYWDEIQANAALAEPLVMGRDLKEAGVTPGPDMGKILKKALEIQYGDSMLSKEEILAMVLPQ